MNAQGTAKRPGSGRAPSRKKRQSAGISRLFVGVHLLLVALPVAVIALWAFADSWAWPNLLPQSFSLRGMEEVFTARNNAGVAVMGQSIAIAFATAFLSTLVAGLAARAVCHYDWVGKNVFSFATMLPFLIPATVFAMGVQVLFIKAGIARTPFGVVLAHSIVALPYAITIMMDVTRAAGTRLEDAARTLGAGSRQTLLHVIIPSLLPGILSSLSMCYIMSFSQYFLTLLIGGGAVRTFALTMFPYLSGGDRTIAAAYGLVFIAATFAVFLLFEFLLKRFGLREERTLYGS